MALEIQLIKHRVMGTPNDEIWPGVSELPDYKRSFPQWSPQRLELLIPDLDEYGIDAIKVGYGVSGLICFGSDVSHSAMLDI